MVILLTTFCSQRRFIDHSPECTSQCNKENFLIRSLMYTLIFNFSYFLYELGGIENHGKLFVVLGSVFEESKKCTNQQIKIRKTIFVSHVLISCISRYGFNQIEGFSKRVLAIFK